MPTYTLNLTEKVEFNINSMYMYVCMYVRMFVCVCVCVCVCLSRYLLSMLFVPLFVYLHVSTYVTLVALHRFCDVTSKNHYRIRII